MQRNKVKLKFIFLLLILVNLSSLVHSTFSPQEFAIEIDGKENLITLSSQGLNEPSTFINLDKGSIIFVGEDDCYAQQLQSKRFLERLRRGVQMQRQADDKEKSAFKSNLRSIVGVLLRRFKELFAIHELQLEESEFLLGREELVHCKQKTVWRTSKHRPSLASLNDYLRSYQQNKTKMVHPAAVKSRKPRAVEDHLIKKSKRRRKLAQRKRGRRNQRRYRSRIQADDSSVPSSPGKIDESSYLSNLNFPPKEANGFQHYEDFHRESIAQPNTNVNPSLPLLGTDPHNFDLPVESSYHFEEGEKLDQTEPAEKVNQEIQFPKMIVKDGTIFYRHDVRKDENGNKPNEDDYLELLPYDGDGTTSNSFHENDDHPSLGVNNIDYQGGHGLNGFIPGSRQIGEAYISHDIHGNNGLFPHLSSQNNDQILHENQSGFLNEKIMPSGFDFITGPISDREATDRGVSAIASAKREDGSSTLAMGTADEGGYFQASAHRYDAGEISHSQVKGDDKSVSGVSSMTTGDQEGKTQVQLQSPYGASSALSKARQGDLVSSALIENNYLERNESILSPTYEQEREPAVGATNGISYKEVLPLQRSGSTLSLHEATHRDLSGYGNDPESNGYSENNIQTIDQNGHLAGGEYAGTREAELHPINREILKENGYADDFKLSSNLNIEPDHLEGNKLETIDQGGLLVGAGNAPRESEIQQVKTGIYTEGGIQSKTDKKDGAVGLVTFPNGQVGSPPGPGELLKQNAKLSVESIQEDLEKSVDPFYDDYLAGLENEPIFNRQLIPLDNFKESHTTPQPYPSPSFYPTPVYENLDEAKIRPLDNSYATDKLDNRPGAGREVSEIHTTPPLDIPLTSDENMKTPVLGTNLDYSQEDLMPPMHTLVVPMELPAEELEEPSMPVVPGEEGGLQRLEPLDSDQPVINVVTLGRNDKVRGLYQREGAELEPGEKIPGAPGFIVPPGFRGRVVYGNTKPVEVDSQKTVQGYNANIRVQPQYPPSGYPIYASVSGPEASKHFLPNQKAGVHIRLGSTYPSASGMTQSSQSNVGRSQRTHLSYRQPQGLVGPQIPGTNLDYNKVSYSPRMDLPHKSWNTGNKPRRTYSKTWNTQWSRSWSNSGNGYSYQRQSKSTSKRNSCGYYTNNCKTTYGPFQTTKICKPLYIEVACCC